MYSDTLYQKTSDLFMFYYKLSFSADKIISSSEKMVFTFHNLMIKVLISH